MWNPEDERIFTPRTFGIGWDINLYRLWKDYPVLFYLLVVMMILYAVVTMRRMLKALGIKGDKNSRM